MMILKKLSANLAFFALAASASAQFTTSGSNIYYNSGNVGIGTTTPDALLTVKGSAHVGSDLILTRTDGFQFGGSIAVDNVTSNAITMWKTGGGNIDFINLMGSSIGLNGKVAVGALFPQRRLDITTADANDGIRIVHNNNGFTQFFANSLPLNAYNVITQTGDAGITYGDYGPISPSTSFGFVIAPWSNTASGIRLDANGNVGIGTATTGSSKLAVEGAITARKVIVTQANPFPDYVFDKNYRLSSLASVDQYIKAHHHLPDIPSADSVARNGLDLGGNQAALLKKIEELTLYVIDQQQQIARLKERDKELEHLQAQIDELKAQQAPAKN
jgi:hypothetical protein